MPRLVEMLHALPWPLHCASPKAVRLVQEVMGPDGQSHSGPGPSWKGWDLCQGGPEAGNCSLGLCIRKMKGEQDL